MASPVANSRIVVYSNPALSNMVQIVWYKDSYGGIPSGFCLPENRLGFAKANNYLKKIPIQRASNGVAH